jgi:type I restriction enzyme, S subunit
MSARNVALGDLATVLNGFAFSSKEYVEQGIRIIRITNVQKGCIRDDNPKFIDQERKNEFDKYMLQEGDILMSLTGNVGRVGVITDALLPAALNQRVGVIKVHSEEVIPDYLFRILNSEEFERNAIENSKGVAQLNLSSKWVEAYEIPLPPLEEQKRIAAILDAADALRAKRRESLAQLDTLLQSTFLEMFGDPITNPMGWDVVNVGDEIGFLTSGSRGWAKYYADRGDTFIRIQNLKNGRLDLSDIAFVNAPESAEAKRTKVEPGDVLLSITADLGRTAVVPHDIGKAHINQHLAILRFAEQDPVFVSYQLASEGGQAQFARLNREGVKAGLNFNDVRSIQLTKPPLDLQHRFATIVESVEKQKTQLKAHLAELDTLFASLQSRAFSGKLDA